MITAADSIKDMLNVSTTVAKTKYITPMNVIGFEYPLIKLIPIMIIVVKTNVMIFPTIVIEIRMLEGNFIFVTSPTFDMIAMAPPVIDAAMNPHGNIPDSRWTINGKSPTSPLGLLIPTPKTNQKTAA